MCECVCACAKILCVCVCVSAHAHTQSRARTATAAPEKQQRRKRTIVGTRTRITTTVKVTAAGHLAQAARATGLVVCRTSANTTKASTVKLVCQLSARAKAILRQRALRVSVTTSFPPHGFPTATVTRTIKIPRTAGSSEPVVG